MRFDSFTVWFCVDDRPHWDVEIQVTTCAPCSVGTLTVRATFTTVDRVVFKVDEGVQVGTRPQVDGTATAAVAAVRSTAGYKFLPAKAEATVPAIAGRDFDVDIVDEHTGLSW